MYEEEINPDDDDFSHITLDTLAIQYSGVALNNQIIGSCSSFAPDQTLGRKLFICY